MSIRARVVLAALVSFLAMSAPAAVFTVTNANDSGPGSLRQAILDSNAAVTSNTINFNIAAAVPVTINVTTNLPFLQQPVTIDGHTQPGYSAGTGNPVIQISPAAGGTATGGLLVAAPDCVIRGLAIGGFSGTAIQTGAANVTIDANYLGTDPTGTVAHPNGTGGLVLGSGVGSMVTGNVISGNANGVTVYGTSVTIQGNKVGTNAAGTAALPNTYNGIDVTSGASSVTVGAAGAGNVISGNGYDGLTINGSPSVSVQYNYVGTNSVGASLGNGRRGIWAYNASSASIYGNTIAANQWEGIWLIGPSGGNCSIDSNRIGTDPGGTTARPNLIDGLHIESNSNSITRNVISGNQRDGVSLSNGATGNRLERNYIGTNGTGSAAVANGRFGVYVTSASYTTVGNGSDGSYNVISGNGQDGIQTTAASSSTYIIHNLIGTNAAGTTAIPNGYSGVALLGPGCWLGGTSLNERNVISGNVRDGVYIGTGGTNTIARGNIIGLNSAGTAAIANGLDGVHIENTTSNSIDGTSSVPSVISGNLRYGVQISGGDHNYVTNSIIGANALASAPLGNALSGVMISGSSSNAVSGSVIGGNGAAGVTVLGSTSSSNEIYNSWVGISPAGAALGNATDGVFVFDAPSTTVGSSTSGYGNHIGRNNIGIEISGVNATGATIIANEIGVFGVTPEPNIAQGIKINASNAEVRGGNVIAFNGAEGVLIYGGTGNQVSGNSITENGALGIDLGATGVLANDPGDADTGVNTLQNYPSVTVANSAAGTTQAQATLNSTPNTAFAVDFFANSACDPTGYGEGAQFLGTAYGTTDSGGNVTVSGSFAVPLARGAKMTATATSGPTNSTSEFSPCFAATVTVGFDPNNDGVVTLSDLMYLINFIFGSGPVPIGSGDATGDHLVDPQDVVYVINYFFAGGPYPH